MGNKKNILILIIIIAVVLLAGTIIFVVVNNKNKVNKTQNINIENSGTKIVAGEEVEWEGNKLLIPKKYKLEEESNEENKKECRIMPTDNSINSYYTVAILDEEQANNNLKTIQADYETNEITFNVANSAWHGCEYKMDSEKGEPLNCGILISTDGERTTQFEFYGQDADSLEIISILKTMKTK